MWAGDAWKGLHKDIVAYIDCKKHLHGFIKRLKVLHFSREDVDYGFVDCVRRRVLAPFLFMELYPKPLFTLWAKSSGLLPKEGIIADGKVDEDSRKIINFVDGAAYHLAIIFVLLMYDKCDYLQDLFRKEKRKCHDLINCYHLDDVMKCLRNDDIYKMIRNCFPETEFTNKMVVAVCAISSVMFHETLESSPDLEKSSEPLTDLEEKMKDMGNGEYKDGDFTQAVASYTKIIKTKHCNSIIYNNRALAFLKLKKWAEAELDGHRVVVLKPTWCKGYYCLVQAIEEQNFVHDAHAISNYGVSRCIYEDCNHVGVLSDTTRRLSRKCKICSDASPDAKKAKTPTKTSRKNNFNHREVSSKNELHDVPDLISDSESDIEINVQKPSESHSKKSPKGSSRLPTLDSLHALLMKEWKLGSQALLSNQYLTSIQHFQNSFNFVSSLNQQNYQIEEFQLAVVNYSLAVANLEIGGIEEIKKSVSLLEEIIKKHKEVMVPWALYKLGCALYKINKFEEALAFLTRGLSVIRNGYFGFKYNWPGTDTLIEETQCEKLTQLLEELLQKCRYPPSPEAVCRLETCQLIRNIFYSDPDFKGFSRVLCHENCRMEYHPQCWKVVKEKSKKKEKDLLGQTCLTPDCQSTISEIRIIDRDGQMKTFECDATKQRDKQRKTKLEKKLELKEKKKQKKRNEKQIRVQGSVENDEPEDHFDEKAPGDVGGDGDAVDNEKADSFEAHDVAATEPEKENVSVNQLHPKLYEDNAEPLYVIKKDADSSNVQSFEVKQSKLKKKGKRKNVMSAEEFCGDRLSESQYYNEYLNRVKNLQLNKELVENGDEDWADLCENYQGKIPDLDPLRPFYIPEELRDNLETLESILQSYGRPNAQEEDDELRHIRENIYSFMEGYLDEHGPMPKDSEMLQHEVETFPPEAQQLIARSGGLANFLLESFNFVEVKNYICVMKDVAKAYCTPTVGTKYEGAYSLDDFADDEIPADKKSNLDDPTMKDILKKCAELVEKENETPDGEEDEESNGQDIQNGDCENGNCDEEADDELSICNFSSSTIRKLSNTLKHATPASQFQLQVLVRSLGEAQQNALLITCMNSLLENGATSEQLHPINKKIKGVELRLTTRTHHRKSQTDKVVISTEEIDTDIYVKLQSLQDENACLQERIIDAEDNLVRSQNQNSMKLKSMDKHIYDLKEDLTAEEATKAAYEAERRNLLQEAKQSKLEQQNAQNAMEKLAKQVDKLNLAVQNQTNENEKLSHALKNEKMATANMQETLNCFLESTEESGKRAVQAEKKFLEMKKSVGVLKLDEAASKCMDTLNRIEEDKRRCGASPFLTAALTQPLEDGKKYIADLKLIKREFLKSCKEQDDALTNGSLPTADLELPSVPDLPNSLKALSTLGALGAPIFPMMPQSMYHQPGMSRFPGHPGSFNPNMMFGPRFPSGPPPMMGSPPGLTRPLHRPPGMEPPPLVNSVQPPKEPDDSPPSLPTSTVNDMPLPSKQPEPFPQKLDEIKPAKEKIPVAKAAALPAATLPTNATYDNLTPIPITGYDSLCDISLEVKKPEPEKCSTGMLLGATAKVEPQANKVALGPAKAASPQSKSRHSSYDKVIVKLQTKFPNIPADRFDNFITRFRARNNNKLSGLTIDQIVDGVTSVIEMSIPVNNNAPGSKAKVIPPRLLTTMELKHPKAPPVAIDHASNILKQGPAWEQKQSQKVLWNSESDSVDKQCCICFEEIAPHLKFKVDCGHDNFHAKCIKQWLKRESTCPMCRVYTLLPDEFPSLD